MNRLKLFALVATLCVLGFVAGDLTPLQAVTYPNCPPGYGPICGFIGEGGPFVCTCVRTGTK